MPQIGFDCRDGLIEFDRCLSGCPSGERCLTRPTLVEIAKTRIWKGMASTTQLLKGTREAMLEIQNDFYIKPKDQAFRLLGTDMHSKLEQNVGKNELAEVTFKDFMSGTADLYEGDNCFLYDYKSTGSYKVGQMLGLRAEQIEHPDGDLYVKKTTRKGVVYQAGDVKMVDKWIRDPELVDNWEYTMQQNRYRLFYEDAGFPVKRMFLQITVRDGGTQMAKQRGVLENMYLIELPIYEREEVMQYFNMKEEQLQHALKKKYCPKCNNRENWDGRKCENWCNVSKFCEEMGE